jgi:flavodoxin
MKVGIIVHSNTGNTLSVAKKLKEKLLAKGHWANIEQVTAVNEKPSPNEKIQLKTIPDTSNYDALIFGAPVQALSLSPVMNMYLSQLPPLNNKKVICFMTQQFPYRWMGGTRAINQIKKICQAKTGSIEEAGVINWSHKERERKIDNVIENTLKLLAK